MAEITCVVNAHRESHLIYPTLQSVDRARRYANACNISTDLLIVLDNADDATREVVSERTSNTDKKIEVSFGELASSRNTAVDNAKSDFIAFIDGDDLWSKTWLVESYNLAKVQKTDCIIHPAYNVYFGGENEYVLEHIGMNSHQFCPHFLLDKNYWTALSFASTSVYRKYPYRPNKLNQGFGYEDWTWNWDTMQENVQHKIAPKTVHFIRKGKNTTSLLEQTNLSNAIPSILDIYSNTYILKNHTGKGKRKNRESELEKSEGYYKEKYFSNLVELEIRNSKLNVQISSKVLGIKEIQLYVDDISHDKKGVHVVNSNNKCIKKEFSFVLNRLVVEKVHKVSVIVNCEHYGVSSRVIHYCPMVESYRSKIASIFYSEYYAEKYSIFNCKGKKEILDHYINYGIYKDHQPNPWFNPIYYRKNYNNKLDKVDNPLISFLLYESEGCLNPCGQIDLDYYKKENTVNSISAFEHLVNIGHRKSLSCIKTNVPKYLIDETMEIGEIEPSLEKYRFHSKRIRKYPIVDRLTYVPAYLGRKYKKNIECIVCVGDISAETNMKNECISVQIRKYGIENVLVCVTDSAQPKQCLYIPEDVEIICLSSDYPLPSSTMRKVWVLHNIIGTLCPEIVVNIDSEVTWRMIVRYGKQLNNKVRLMCGIQTMSGGCVSTILTNKYLSESMEYINTIFTEDIYVIEKLEKIFGFPKRVMEKIQIMNSS